MASHPFHAYRSSLDNPMFHIGALQAKKNGTLSSPSSFNSLPSASVDDPSSSTSSTNSSNSSTSHDGLNSPLQTLFPFGWTNIFSPSSSPKKTQNKIPTSAQTETEIESEAQKENVVTTNKEIRLRRRRSRANFYQPRISTNETILGGKHQQIIINKIHEYVTVRYLTYDWQRIYSTLHDGISLNTFYNQCSQYTKYHPIILFIKDTNGNIFGSYVSTPWHPHSNYYGNGETFVFSINQHSNNVSIYPWNKSSNSYFQLSNNEFLALGGGGKFALFIDSMFEKGSSHSCTTFNNPCLTTSEHFNILDIEAYTLVPPNQLIINDENNYNNE